MFKTLIVMTGLALAVVLSPAAQAEKRIALVIGNSDYYSGGSLANPERDARAVARKLGSLGFDVVDGYNLGYEDLRETVRSFARETRDADLTVFYYAGHGISVDNVNYIVPIDATMSDAFDWEFEVYALPEVLRLIGRSNGASLVFLDACRDNPMAQKLAQVQGMSTRSLGTRGLAPVAFERLGTTGSVIAYATEPGQVAMDGDGDNSPFTTAVLRHIGTANADFASLTSLITRDVLDMTGGEQRPRFDVSLTGPLILNRVDTVTTAAATTAITPAPATGSASLEVEKIVFDTARETGDIADYQAYLDAYPQGAFAVLARNAIARLEQESGARITGSTATASAAGVDGFAVKTVNYRSTDPLVLTVTDQGRSQVSSRATEDQLGMTKQQRKEVQLRLNLSGNSVGRPDGIIGNGTRRGISAWQGQVGFPVTGYLNMVQHQMLVANTEAAFNAHMAANPSALAASSGSGTKRRKSSGNNAAVGAFIGGVAAGILLSK